MSIPIAQDRPGFQSLSLDLRYRRSDYDTGFDANTWNIGGEWSPIEGLMIRGGQSQAVRAPNILELYQPQSQGLWGGTDPCAGPTPELTAAQCANSGVTGAQYGSIPLSPAGQYNGLYGGNTALQPETSDSFTAGVVFTPEAFLEGLSLSVDYWSIDVQDAISTVDEEFTITQCGLTGDPALCGLINRGPNGNLWIGTATVSATNVNIGFLEVAGYDITGNYVTDIGAHTLNFTLRGTLVETWDSQPVLGFDVNDCVGAWGGDQTASSESSPIKALRILSGGRSVVVNGVKRCAIDELVYIPIMLACQVSLPPPAFQAEAARWGKESAMSADTPAGDDRKAATACTPKLHVGPGAAWQR
jgi:outer membrane receptor protein involved in Fe transport